jgi:transcriptional regulator GlxA family with amidase domain
MSSSSKIIKIALLAFDDISAFHLSVPCMVFQDVYIGHPAPFSLNICAESSKELTSTSGFGITVKDDLSVMALADIIIIPSWPNNLPEPSETLIQVLKAQHQRGVLLIGLCLGSYPLACAGILAGKRVTTHWAFASNFQSRFPAITVDADPLFIEHDQVITSAGTAASLDCCLHVVRRYCGSEVANRVARIMVTAPFRSGGQQQYIPLPISEAPLTDTSLNHVIECVANNLDRSYSLDQVAAMCATSKRTFTRQFKSAYGCTFGDWLLTQRLIHCQHLLETTTSSIAQITEMAGFGSESVLRKHFKAAFHVSPTQWRATFRQ